MLSSAFINTPNLTSVDITATSNTTMDVAAIFGNSGITEIPMGIDWTKVDHANFAFSDSKIHHFANLSLNSVTEENMMFSNCNSIQDATAEIHFGAKCKSLASCFIDTYNVDGLVLYIEDNVDCTSMFMILDPNRDIDSHIEIHAKSEYQPSPIASMDSMFEGRAKMTVWPFYWKSGYSMTLFVFSASRMFYGCQNLFPTEHRCNTVFITVYPISGTSRRQSLDNMFAQCNIWKYVRSSNVAINLTNKTSTEVSAKLAISNFSKPSIDIKLTGKVSGPFIVPVNNTTPFMNTQYNNITPEYPDIHIYNNNSFSLNIPSECRGYPMISFAETTIIDKFYMSTSYNTKIIADIEKFPTNWVANVSISYEIALADLKVLLHRRGNPMKPGGDHTTKISSGGGIIDNGATIPGLPAGRTVVLDISAANQACKDYFASHPIQGVTIQS